VVALHKDRHIFPVMVAVTKAAGSGADATFMGVIRVRGGADWGPGVAGGCGLVFLTAS
jgi:hypothetical protein